MASIPQCSTKLSSTQVTHGSLPTTTSHASSPRPPPAVFYATLRARLGRGPALRPGRRPPGTGQGLGDPATPSARGCCAGGRRRGSRGETRGLRERGTPEAPRLGEGAADARGPGDRRAVTSARDRPVRGEQGRGEADDGAGRAAGVAGGGRASAAGPAGRRDASLRPGDRGGRGRGRERRQGACSEPGSSRGRGARAGLPSSCSPGSLPRPCPCPRPLGPPCARRPLPASSRRRRALCFHSPGRSSDASR